MFCSQCGKRIEDGAKFCAYCGAVQEAGGVAKASAEAGGGKDMQPQTVVKRKKGKGGLIAIISVAVVLAAAGVAGSILYFTSDSYASRKIMKLAEECFDREEYEEALTYYEEALERAPDLTDAYLRSADILLLDEKYGEAVKILQKGLKKTRNDEDAQELLTEKTEEVNRMETAAVSKRLQKYLDKELVPQYGYADLAPQVKAFDMGTVYEESGNWTGLSGIANTRLCDLDGDGRDELMVLVLGEANINVSVYEVENNSVIKKAECSEERVGDMTGCSEIWSMLDAESGKYLYCSQNYWAIIVDGVYEAVKLYRYDGENLYTPLVIECGWGSSDFIYKAYQYSRNGEKLAEEILYDQTGYNMEDRTWEYYDRRVAELFAEYGITTASDQGNLIVDNEYEELLALNMWGDYRSYYSVCDTIVYHFNDWDSPLLAYDRFLRGEETLKVRDGAWYCGGRHEEWTFQDILTEVQNEYLKYSDRSEVSRVEYAFLDCGGDGVEEMQVRFVGLDIYAPGDDSDLTMVIYCRDGQLELIYSCESWARSSTEIDFYGCISSGGADGAGAYLFDIEYIDGNGNVQIVYNAEELWGWWASFISITAYNTVFGGYDPDIGVVCYTINGEDYYVLYADEDIWEYQYFVSLCEQEGRRFVKEDEIDKLINRRMRELGIQEAWKLGNGVCWNTYWYDRNVIY